ncbi:Lrp/AsnC family transcriptional regulator [Pelosinus sp. UFO1]|uniref:siroheme decarboxylase subunit alpha n=1 Tax=Pelosinus sp. UFO1 TaxID=484770 RepID=UPI0004D0EEE4|nr:Lrp/AsnC family transcriptional regulator [Pelosinus sp. UFO1]AIF52570.1 putative transcriptional regulator, AsnC family [Pelosinus sp. UFO1]
MLTAFDKSLLNLIQTDLSFDKRPFAVLAEKLKTEEFVVIERLKFLKEQGLIRRIGPFFDSTKLGYIGTLVALEVKEEYIPQVAEVINSYYGVTHNYEREGTLNLWFTLLSPDLGKQNEILETVRNLDGVVRLLNLPATKKFKVSVQFSLS